VISKTLISLILKFAERVKRDWPTLVSSMSASQGSPTVGICVAVIANTNVNVAQSWTIRGIALDCVLLLLGLQCEFPRGGVAWIIQREKKTFQALVAFVLVVHQVAATPIPAA
jgi:hypothetical protein